MPKLDHGAKLGYQLSYGFREKNVANKGFGTEFP